MRNVFRRLARLVGNVLLGGSIVLLLFAVALFGIGAYLIAIPYARLSKKHSQLLALVQFAQAGAALLAVMRSEGDELGGDPSAAADRAAN